MRCLQSSSLVVAFWQLNMSLIIKNKERKETFKEDASKAMANAMKIAPKRVGTLDGIPEQVSTANSHSKDSTTSYIMGRASDVSSGNTDSQVSLIFKVFLSKIPHLF